MKRPPRASEVSSGLVCAHVSVFMCVHIGCVFACVCVCSVQMCWVSCKYTLCLCRPTSVHVDMGAHTYVHKYIQHVFAMYTCSHVCACVCTHARRCTRICICVWYGRMYIYVYTHLHCTCMHTCERACEYTHKGTLVYVCVCGHSMRVRVGSGPRLWVRNCNRARVTRKW